MGDAKRDAAFQTHTDTVAKDRIGRFGQHITS